MDSMEGWWSVGPWRKAVGQWCWRSWCEVGMRVSGGLGNDIAEVGRFQFTEGLMWGLMSICRQWWDPEGYTQKRYLFLQCCDMVWGGDEEGGGPGAQRDVRMVGCSDGHWRWWNGQKPTGGTQEEVFEMDIEGGIVGSLPFWDTHFTARSKGLLVEWLLKLIKRRLPGSDDW